MTLECQALLEARLAPLGFRCETLVSNGVTNMWARLGTQEPLVCFAGHTDVVPHLARSTRGIRIRSSPSCATANLYGRGRRRHEKLARRVRQRRSRSFSRTRRSPPARSAFSLLPTRKGPSIDGTVKVVERLAAARRAHRLLRGGRAFFSGRAWDMIKNGRRGTLSGTLVVKGVQGHIAYPHLARNPIHLAAP
jgi:succinyl-diaminopimelate desuccinylase